MCNPNFFRGRSGRFLTSLGLLSLISGFSPLAAAPAKVTHLRCEYRVNPQGIDANSPRLSWIIETDERSWKQSSYRIQVASSPEQLRNGAADRWDSGRVTSDQTVSIPYAGQALASRDQCYWQVQAWDEGGQPTAVSEIAHWSMGLLHPTDWQAEYISYRDDTPVFRDRESAVPPAARQYRKTFSRGQGSTGHVVCHGLGHLRTVISTANASAMCCLLPAGPTITSGHTTTRTT